MRRKVKWTVVWVMVIALMAAGMMWPAASRPAALEQEAGAMAEGVDPAAMDLGNADAAGMMALINRSVSLNAR